MNFYFDSYGPFEFDPTPKDRAWKSKFWSPIKNDEYYPKDLEKAIGCYAFCITHGNNTKPWYVGKTVAISGFSGEVFNQRNVRHYRKISNDKRGTPSIILFPLVTRERWSISRNRTSSVAYIDWLETTLIGMAVTKNPDVVNVGKTKHYRRTYVNGIIGSQFQGAPTLGAQHAKATFL